VVDEKILASCCSCCREFFIGESRLEADLQRPEEGDLLLAEFGMNGLSEFICLGNTTALPDKGGELADSKRDPLRERWPNRSRPFAAMRYAAVDARRPERRLSRKSCSSSGARKTKKIPGATATGLAARGLGDDGAAAPRVGSISGTCRAR